MPELHLRVSDSQDRVDMIARYDGQTTIGALADALERVNDRAGDRPRTIRRISRGSRDMARDATIAQSDLRSGDEVSLALDSGVRERQTESAVANLRVLEGPDAGRTFELRRGESAIGRSAKNELVLNDDMVSRRHAVFRVSDMVEVADSGSTNGVVVNDETITGLRRLRPGDTVRIGNTTLLVDLLARQHDAVTVAENAVEFNRPPRIERPFEPFKLQLANPVDPLRKPRIPLISALVPLVMGLVMYLVTKTWLTVVFLGMSPLLVLGNFVETRRSSRRDHADAVAEYEATMHDQRARLDAARSEEIRSRHRFSPSNDELLTCVADLTSRLWERELDHRDFLDLRVGLREQVSRVVVEMPSGGKRDQRRELQRIVDQYRLLPPVPIAIRGRSRSPIGVAGPKPQADGVARSLILQAATLHSPHDLVIGALVAESNRDDWDWLKWLPHCATTGGAELSSPLVVGADDGVGWVVGFQQLIERRLPAAPDAGADEAVFHPHILLLIDSETAVERGRMSALLKAGSRAGISVIWITEDGRKVPNACRSVILVEPGGTTLTVGDSVDGIELGGVPIEPMDLDAAETVARAMAPIIDISSDRIGGSDLPPMVSLIDLFGGTELLQDPKFLRLRWASASPKALPAPVGAYEGGVLSIDIRVDGPHGLVAGTTGSGKSEFLQSFLASLAMNHSPERINFLLVDYKGGSAFGDLVDQLDKDGNLEWQGLRHTVGMITDLTPALVRRALVSLQAELVRREELLNHHRVKDLMEMEKRGIENTPPNLLIVVDEFAALASEVPEFVEGVVDIAQRGRSLGLHLLLATQKPGGVITPSIQANTNLRVALRMANEEESQDVVRSPIAAQFDRSVPGRGVVKRGPTDLVAFQSAYVGGVTPPARKATLELGEFTLGNVHWIGTNRTAPVDPHAESDLKRIVRAVNVSADDAGIGEPRRPWLDPLPATVDLLNLPRPASDSVIPIGLADLPARQTREPVFFQPDDQGSMLIFGMGGTGKTVALRALATAFALTKDRSPVHVHGLDFAGRGLDMLAPLPHVGSIIASDEHAMVQRLFADLAGEVAERSRTFARARASNLAEYRAAVGTEYAPARIVVLLDGYDNFQAIYERIDRGRLIEQLPRLIGSGRQHGIHFVLTGTRRASFPMALASQISARLVLRLASPDDYHSVNVDPSSFDENSPPGRMQYGGVEVQGALVGGEQSTAAEAAAIERLAHDLVSRTTTAPPVRILPEVVYRSDQPPAERARWALTNDFDVIGPDFSSNIVIAGPARSGKTMALASLANAASECGGTVEIFSSKSDPALPGARTFDDLEAALERSDDRLIFIDDGEKLTGTPLDAKVQQAIANGTHRLVVAAEVTTARGYDPTFKLLRARADVCVLSPNPDADEDLLGARIERSSQAFPPGRALIRLGDTVNLAHILI